MASDKRLQVCMIIESVIKPEYVYENKTKKPADFIFNSEPLALATA